MANTITINDDYTLSPILLKIVNNQPSTFSSPSLSIPVTFISQSSSEVHIEEMEDLAFSLLLNYNERETINLSIPIPSDKTKIVKLGFRCIFQSNLNTLSDIEVNGKVQEILDPILKIEGVSIPGM